MELAENKFSSLIIETLSPKARNPTGVHRSIALTTILL